MIFFPNLTHLPPFTSTISKYQKWKKNKVVSQMAIHNFCGLLWEHSSKTFFEKNLIIGGLLWALAYLGKDCTLSASEIQLSIYNVEIAKSCKRLQLHYHNWGINLYLEKVQVKIQVRIKRNLTFFIGLVNLDIFPGPNL